MSFCVFLARGKNLGAFSLGKMDFLFPFTSFYFSVPHLFSRANGERKKKSLDTKGAGRGRIGGENLLVTLFSW